MRRHHRPAAWTAGYWKRAGVRFRFPAGNEIGGPAKAVLPLRRAKGQRPALDELFVEEARGPRVTRFSWSVTRHPVRHDRAPEESLQTDPSTATAGDGGMDWVKGSRSMRAPVARDRDR